MEKRVKELDAGRWLPGWIKDSELQKEGSEDTADGAQGLRPRLGGLSGLRDLLARG